MKKILCLGAGINSTAILVLASEGKVQVDLAIFADTGAEHPETYEYLTQTLMPFCHQSNIPIVTVRREGFKPLYDYYFDHKVIPSRRFRHCTSKYKIRPIAKYCQEHFPEGFRLLMGIDASEKHRATATDVDYPLIELDIDRKGCRTIITKAGLPIPRKSGCYVCPFTTNRNWVKLLKEHPELYDKAELLEKNGRGYPEFIFRTIPLERLRKSELNQRKLCDFDGMESCVFCEVQS